ncbi:aldo/keto reductase [Aurantivibrio plasticivorans]
MKTVVILQARTNSTRLPAKVLLPVGGFPLAVLAAKRAANRGLEVIVATSNQTSDDALAEILEMHGIRYHRGSLSNTLGRIVNALEGYSDDTLVFRLTADNLFPDGCLLEEIHSMFVEKNLDYLCCNGKNSGLPYGMSAEITRLAYLRKANANAVSKFDQEHVTPYIRRRYGEAYFDNYKTLAKGHLRCTVDCLDDYLSIQKVFSAVEDPINVSAFSLIDLLEKSTRQPLQSQLVNKLVLGTAQLGLPYGISNESGQPDQETAELMIKTSITNGTVFIDTARAYGNSENVIGQALSSGWAGRAQVITKLSPLNDCPTEATPEVVNAFVDASLYQSISNLQAQTLDVLMLHRASQLMDWHGAVLRRLNEYREAGIVKALGVSVQTPDELNLALKLNHISFIQMPLNVLDWRWDELVPRIIQEKETRKITIHARSVFLQGLLLSRSKLHWQNANVSSQELIIQWLEKQAQKHDRRSVADFCVSFVKSIGWIDGLVIGMETIDQLKANIEIFCADDLSPKDMTEIKENRPRVGLDTLNPACWR